MHDSIKVIRIEIWARTATGMCRQKFRSGLRRIAMSSALGSDDARKTAVIFEAVERQSEDICQARMHQNS